jgi:hypothetical protein
MERSLADFFRSGVPARDKFTARLFGLFSEELVRDWCTDPRAPFDDLGRPTVSAPGETRGKTLDFTLRDRKTHEVFVAEMKAELEFEGYRYMTLEGVEQLAHHRLPAFQRFLQLAREPSDLEVRVRAQPTAVDGAILIWGAVSSSGKRVVMAHTGLHDVLSVEDVLADLRKWRPRVYLDRIAALRAASNELFEWVL